MLTILHHNIHWDYSYSTKKYMYSKHRWNIYYINWDKFKNLLKILYFEVHAWTLTRRTCTVRAPLCVRRKAKKQVEPASPRHTGINWITPGTRRYRFGQKWWCWEAPTPKTKAPPLRNLKRGLQLKWRWSLPPQKPQRAHRNYSLYRQTPQASQTQK